MTFGEHLKLIRISKGISQSELGERLGISQQQIAKYEKREDYPKLNTMKKLAQALGVQTEELFYSEGRLILDAASPASNVSAVYDMNELQETLKAQEEVSSILKTMNAEGRQRLLEYARLIQEAYNKRNNENEYPQE